MKEPQKLPHSKKMMDSEMSEMKERLKHWKSISTENKLRWLEDALYFFDQSKKK